MKDRIKKIREHFGLTQEQFAQRINKSYALISLVETGKKNFSGKTLEKICSILDCTPNDVVQFTK